MSTNTNNPVFQQTESVTLSSGYTVAQTDIATGPGYVGRDWILGNGVWRSSISNRNTNPGNQDETKEIRFTLPSGFNSLGLSFPIGSYTTPDGGVMPANTQRITLTNGRLESRTSGFANKTNSFTVGGGLSYHKWAGTTYNYTAPNTNINILRTNLTYTYNPAAGTDTLASGFDLAVRLVEQENTSNNIWEGQPDVAPLLTGTATSYYIGNLFIIDGIDGDAFDTVEIRANTSIDSICLVSADITLDSSFSTSASAGNTVGFPREGESIPYFAEGFVQGEVFVAADYIADDYFVAEQYMEDGVAFSAGGVMRQDYNADQSLAVLGGLLLPGDTAVEGDFAAVYTGTRIKQISSDLAGFDTQSDFGIGVIWSPGIYAPESDTQTLFSAGRIQQLAASVSAEYAETIGSNIFVESSGSGIISASSGLGAQGGYLQVLGNNTFSGDSSLDIEFGGGTTAGIILGGFEWLPELDTSMSTLGGLSLPLEGDFTASVELNTTPGYLMNNWNLDPVTADAQLAALASIVFVQQCFMEAEFSSDEPTILAGYGLFADADLQGIAYQLSAGRLWIVDPYRTIVVKPERRGFSVLAESRHYTPHRETRVFNTLPETNTVKVKPESRVYTIPLTAATRKNDTRLERV